MLQSLVCLLREWSRRFRSRREIGRLDEHDLRDLCQSRGQMSFEANKPFWRA
jgi:uncharacterized protein YjiS (DUF1127 family)